MLHYSHHYTKLSIGKPLGRSPNALPSRPRSGCRRLPGDGRQGFHACWPFGFVYFQIFLDFRDDMDMDWHLAGLRVDGVSGFYKPRTLSVLGDGGFV